MWYNVYHGIGAAAACGASKEEMLLMAGLYLACFLLCGILTVRWLLPRHPVLNRLWLGASLGLLEMMWLPALCAFALRFTIAAHIAALGLLGVITALCYAVRDRRPVKEWDAEETRQLRQLLLIVLPLTLLGGYLQYTHSLRVDANGNWNVGQSTYGDLPMHTAFITGLRNASFPPDYPFYPGHQLSYPFLVDSLSTSFMMMGCSLQLSLILPGTLMMALCYTGVMLLAREMTTGKKTVVLAALLFFLNGGLGFLYNFDLAGGDSATVWSRVQEILQGYYKTPTNQPEPNNLRWSNVIADLMIPQRTLLGGWCMVIPCFYLLFTAFGENRLRSAGGLRAVLLLGVWAGGLPLIQTHAFLALGLCSLGLLVFDMTEGTRFPRAVLLLTIAFAIALGFAMQSYGEGMQSYEREVAQGADYWAALELERVQEAKRLAIACAAGLSVSVLLLAGLAVLQLARSREQFAAKAGHMVRTLGRYLPYGVTAVALAAPQLILFTFAQAFMNVGTASAGHTFLQMKFNWVNNPGRNGLKDLYLWFYIKNIGLPFVALLLALCERNRRTRRIFAGAFAIILAAEFVRFQPNDYDNNKLFYLAWLLCCMIVADYAAILWRRLRGLRARPLMAAACAVVLFLSAGLTLWRECVSSYQAFGRDAVEAAAWVEENTDEDAVFVTGTHHLNPISSIAGRTIVCGPDLWLYWHGFDTTERKEQLRAFYADPEAHADMLREYGADYIAVSSYERSDYQVNTEALQRLYPVVFENREMTIYQVQP